MATREQAKHRRRTRILDAARALMADGDTEFSMRRLAETAGVSIATPYNLIGSKQAVMFAVMEQDFAEFARLLDDAHPADPLERPFYAVSVAAAGYARAPDYHRAVLFAAYNDGGRDYRSLFAGTGHAIWRRMIEAAIDAGTLRPTADPDAFAAVLEQQLFACVLEWVRDEIGVDELELRAHYAFSLVLLGMAEDAARGPLEARAERTQRELLALWTARADAAPAGLAGEA